MKNLMKNGLLGCLMAMFPTMALAQEPIVAERGGQVELAAAEGYTNYQWQVSSDGKCFVNVPDGNLQNLKLKVFAPNFYRVKVKNEQNKYVYLDTLTVKPKDIRYSSKVCITGGSHGYVESKDGKVGVGGISIPEDKEDGKVAMNKKLTRWKDGNAMAVYYFSHPKTTVDTKMFLRVALGANVSFRVKVFDPENMEEPMAENILAFKGTGTEQCVDLVGLAFAHRKYYRYQLECLSGWNSIIEISKFRHFSPSRMETYKANNLSSPSVHLGSWRSTDGTAPSGQCYDWCYEEVMMPKVSDVIGTYIMSLGVLDGYMGIQHNGFDKDGKPIHGVIFSMWDNGSTEVDPNLPMNLRANVLDHGKDVVPSRFGGEGTGMKTYKFGYNWECDTFVQFITNTRPEKSVYKVVVNGKEEYREQENTLVSAWYNAQDGKGWQYMATLRLPKKKKSMNTWYSFLEDYNYATGQALRKGYYRNGYGHAMTTNKWYHFNKVNFTHTDGGPEEGARYDYGQGASEEYPGAFFMQSGAYLPTKKTADEVPLNEVNTPVDTIDLNALTRRVDQAVAYEKEQIEKEEQFNKNLIDKKEWSLIDFSTEEALSEGSNGRAAQIIDGNVNTYWHSQWQGHSAKYPHHFTVDMKQPYEIDGMEITMSGGTNRYIKAFDLYLSNDGQQWNKVYSDSDAPKKETFRFLIENPSVGRYFKLVITDGRANDGCHVRINEIELTGKPVPTGIEGLKAGEDLFKVAMTNTGVAVKLLKPADDVVVALYRADGANVFNQSYERLTVEEVVNIPMRGNAQGAYVLSCKIDGKQYNKQIVWK